MTRKGRAVFLQTELSSCHESAWTLCPFLYNKWYRTFLQWIQSPRLHQSVFFILLIIKIHLSVFQSYFIICRLYMYLLLITFEWNIRIFSGQQLGAPSPLPYLDPSLTGNALLVGANFASTGVGILNDTGVQFVRISILSVWRSIDLCNLKKMQLLF